ncbi:hypothetical protein C7M61_003357 [Candidozyma pseudohaemuli]|uniref:2,5-diamino-6-ribosylamino-4(3H)-pyrimidinone 5'-phosphate reductase n=1 Tax=Candidozyma pseudohaemuli TaxID=418784 RepID=A0A2P7YNY3_9ASCO|nr:hypothetical protein C7M61_003357 [[Candida] pseudohaemulonii]PSK37650.1 hypothetical protein C7M61_003357 [[Candida] pseudohaemulonii]
MELDTDLGRTLEPFLPPITQKSTSAKDTNSVDATSDVNLPFITLTWAQSLDGRIAAGSGTRTRISGPETKVMTHYQRSRHDAILVGANTAVTDDPKLNCRYPETGVNMIRPVIVDPSARWTYSSSTARKVLLEKQGIAPFVLIRMDTKIPTEEEDLLNGDGGQFIRLDFPKDPRENWLQIFQKLCSLGIQSVMVEGGAFVIESLLTTNLPDSVVVTIGSVFLGKEGVSVSPKAVQTLKDVVWWRGQEDAVMASRLTSK